MLEGVGLPTHVPVVASTMYPGGAKDAHAGHKKCIFEKGRATNRGAALRGVSEEGALDPNLIRWREGEDGYGGRRSGY